MKKIINNLGKIIEDMAIFVIAVVVILIITNLFAQRADYKEMTKELLTISKNYESRTTRCMSLLD